MSATARIAPFGFGTLPVASDIALLHGQLLPWSPISILGRRFMEKFYYRDLPRDGHIFGAVAYAGGRPAGFISATLDSDGFMTAALRRRFWTLAWVAGTSLCLDPRRLAGVWEAWRIMRSRTVAGRTVIYAEVLSVGVAPEFRRAVQGPRLGMELMAHVLSAFTRHDVRIARSIVDADNTQARRFHETMGWKPGREFVPGWRQPSIEYIWRPAPQAPAQIERSTFRN